MCGVSPTTRYVSSIYKEDSLTSNRVERLTDLKVPLVVVIENFTMTVSGLRISSFILVVRPLKVVKTGQLLGTRTKVNEQSFAVNKIMSYKFSVIINITIVVIKIY